MDAPRIRRWFVLAALAFGLAACGGSGGQKIVPDAANAPDAPTVPESPAPPAPPVIGALQAGQWLELPETRIRSVLPDPVPQGDPAGITMAWSGGTVDTRRNRLLVWGGGHGDYWGNEIYAIDLGTLTVQRIVDPSPHTAQSNCSSALPDGTPVARHTYGGLAYLHHADRLFAVNGAMTPCGNNDSATWTYDFTSSRWMQMTGASPSRSFGTMAVYDPATRQVYVKDQYDFYAYRLEDNRYVRLNAARQFVDYHLSAAIDTKRRKFVMIGDGVRVIDLGTYQMTTMATRNAPEFVTSKQSPGIAYEPVADRIVAWHGGSQVHALDMDSGEWTQVANSAGPSAPAPTQGTFGRWGYVPGYGVFIVVNDIDQNAWVFKLR